MAIVYAFPPVETVSDEWTIEAPINSSRSFFTGKRMVSASQRARRIASFAVSSRAPTGSGAGYMENLKILLAGGENLVRLHSPSINPWEISKQAKILRQSEFRNWTAPQDDDFEWTDGHPLNWVDGRVIYGEAIVDAAGFPALAIENGPPNFIIARPADLVTLFSPPTAITGSTVRVMTEAKTDATGSAVIRLMSALSGSGRVNIGVSESGVFEAVSIPRSAQPLTGDWLYQWEFREVFADEVEGGFVEVDPWR